MTKEEYMKIKQGLDGAQDSTIPFPVVQDDTIAVVGDANKTENKKYDYTIRFCIPHKTEKGLEVTTKDKEYKDVYITPRQQATLQKVMVEFLMYFRKPNKEDGSVADYTQDELNQIIASMDEKITDDMYMLVGTVLGVDEDLREYMMPSSVLSALNKIIRNYPDMVNSADTFFE